MRLMLRIWIVSLVVICCQCQVKWIEHDGVWYFRSPNKLNFSAAISYCNENRTNIAIVTDKNQNTFLKDNEFTGWIGLTNTAIWSYTTTVTLNGSVTNGPSFLDKWIWTVHSWNIVISKQSAQNKSAIDPDSTSGLNPDNFKNNLSFDMKEVKHASSQSAVVLSGGEFWKIENTASLHNVICEWQCGKLNITTNHSEIQNGVYERQGYVNTRRYYNMSRKTPRGDTHLYYSYGSSDFWVINNMVSPSGYIIYLKSEVHLPIHSNEWKDKNISVDVTFKCIDSVSDQFMLTYSTTVYECTGFAVYLINASQEYLYLYDLQGTKYWCTGYYACTDNITACNTYTTPFPDKLNGEWVHPDTLAESIHESVSVTSPELIDTTSDLNNLTNELKSEENYILHIGIGCAIGVLCIIVVVVLVLVICRRKYSHKTTSNECKYPETTKPEFKDYTYVCARDVIQQNGVNNNIAMRILTQLDTENENCHMYSLEKIPQVNTNPINGDILKQSEYNTNINQTCYTYEDIETIHDQNLTDSDKAKAQRLVDTSPKPVKPPRTFAHESVHSDEESPPPPVPSKGVLDSGTKTVFDNIVFDKDEEHDIELFENTIYETNVTK